MNSRGTGIESSRDEIDIRAALSKLFKHYKLIAATTTTFAMLGVLYAFFSTPIYRADIMVQVEDGYDLSSARATNLLNGLTALFDIKSTDDGEMQILDSRLVTSSIVDKLSLDIEAKPRRFPLVGTFIARHARTLSTPGFAGFGGYAWGTERIVVKRFDVPAPFEGDRFTITSLGKGRFALSGRDLDASVIGTIGVPLQVATGRDDITLLVAELDGLPGAKFELRRHSAQQTLEHLRKHLAIAELGKEMSGIIGITYDNADSSLAAAVLNEVAHNYVEQNIERKTAAANKALIFLNSQLPGIEKHLHDAEDRLNAFQNRYGIVDLGEQAKTLLTQSASAKSMLFQLQQKRKELAATFTGQHPLLIALDQQIAAARSSVDGFDQAIRKLPDTQQNIVRLDREVTVQTGLYISLLNSIQQIQMATASKSGNVRIIDYATTPDLPIKPKRALTIALSIVMGLFVGVGTAVVRSLFTVDRVTDPMKIERDTAQLVLATIPADGPRRRLGRSGMRSISHEPAIFALTHPQEPATEALRGLCIAMQFELASRANGNIILITEPSSDLGKSFISANTAILFGMVEKRVLLVDFDLRRSQLTADFGVTDPLGLTDVLGVGLPVEQAILPEVARNVDLLPAGPLLPYPVEQLSRTVLSEILTRVSARYDLVILDVPPLLPAPDAMLIAPFAGIIVLTACSGVTTCGEIVESVRRLERVGTTPTGVVLTGFESGRCSTRYGNYGEYASRHRTKTAPQRVPA